MTTRRPVERRPDKNVRSHLGAALALALALLVVATAGAGTTGSGAAKAKNKKVLVRVRDTGFVLSSVFAPIGNVTFVVHNLGKLNHTFRIAGHRTPVLKPRQSAKLVVTFKKAGYFPYASTLPGQARKGLKGRFTIAPPGKIIAVHIRDAGVKLSSKVAPAGWVTFVVSNVGKLHHVFRVGAKRTPLLEPGTSTGLIVKFAKAGAYAYTVMATKVKGQITITAPKTTTTKPATTTPTTTKPVTTTPSTTTTTAGGGNAAAGKTTFISTCGACHTLKAAGTVGTIGTNLDSVQLPLATIISVVTNGKSGAAGSMPPFKGTLTSTQIADVAAFIYSAEHS